MTTALASPPAATQDLVGVRRPHRNLLVYYTLQALLTGPGIVVVWWFFFFRFRTLQYHFDEQGVTVRWGILFRREVSLTYARIQDIHLVSNLIERWLGLGRIQIQTASGNAAAELTVEGLRDFENVRDELYVRMRGARSTPRATAERIAAAGAPLALAEPDAVRVALHQAVAELRALREAIERKG